MAAIPQQLIYLPKVSGVKSIKNEVIEIYPVNASVTSEFSFSGNNIISFNFPAYKDGFFNPTRSMFRFTARTATGATWQFANGVPIINRMVLRSGNGQILEDIQDYSVLQRLLSNFEDKCEIEAKAYLTGDYRGTSGGKSLANNQTSLSTNEKNGGQTFLHPLLSGLLGKYQEHYVPVGLFHASGGYAFNLELYLEDPKICMINAHTSGVPSYTLSNVVFQSEIVTLPSEVSDRISKSINNNETIPVPFTTYRLHKAHVAQTSTSVDVNISESAHDLEAVYTVLRPQVFSVIHDATSYLDLDNLSFHGSVGTNKLKSYQFRYGTEMYPNAAAKMGKSDTKVGLLNALSTLDLLHGRNPLCASMTDDGTVPRSFWDEMNNFTIVQSFKTSRDGFHNGLNSSSTGAPLQLQIEFDSGVTEALQIESFIKANYTLMVMAGGQTSIVQG